MPAAVAVNGLLREQRQEENSDIHIIYTYIYLYVYIHSLTALPVDSPRKCTQPHESLQANDRSNLSFKESLSCSSKAFVVSSPWLDYQQSKLPSCWNKMGSLNQKSPN
jgi:hypothetical protein